ETSLEAKAQPAHPEAIDDPRHYPIDMRPFADSVDAGAFGIPNFDDEGIVQVEMQVGDDKIAIVHNPVTAAQYALGSYERFLHDGDARAYEDFVRHATWLRDQLDDRGRINYLFYMRSKDIKPPWISAMAQGQAISVFVRMARETDDDSWLDAARLAMTPMLSPADEGGTLYMDGDDVWLEEYPESPPSHVFNGHVFASFGLNDLARATGDEDILRFWEAATATIAANLERYENDGWLRYDLKDTDIAPRQYHRIQRDQVYMLASLTGDERFEDAARRWNAPYENRDGWLRSRFWARFSEAVRGR
ncbi:MAG: hypothetical protein CVT69_01260, partial [Actinobacteria bacterium HGW-Actinobacteria-9]